MAGRISRVLIAGFILWMLWGERVYWPAARSLPVNTIRIESIEAFRALAPGREIAIEGTVFPAETEASESLWQERFAYRLASWQKDEFGSTREVVTRLIRPAIRFEWAGGAVAVPADSYKMEAAPEAPGDSALRAAERNVGFRSGDSALALGRKVGEGAIAVDQLAIGPLDVYLQKLERENTWRAWIGHGLRVVVSLFALSMVLGALRRASPCSESAAPETAHN